MARNDNARFRLAGLMMLAMTSGSGPALALDPETALTSFDQVWNQVRDQYFDYPRIESDWQTARSALRPQAAEAANLDELRRLLSELLARIGESHFGLLPDEFMNRLDALPDQHADEDAGTTSTGLGVRLIDGRIVAARVRPDSPAWRAGIRPGWELVAVDDESFDALLTQTTADETPDEARRANQLLEFALHGLLAYPDTGRTLSLAFIDPDGKARRLDLTGDPRRVELLQLGNLPPMPFEWQLERIERGGHCVMQLTFSTWVPELNAVLRARREELLQCPGLVIDLRGNPGGVMTTMVSLAADLVDRPITLGSLLRTDGQIDFRVLPRLVALDGRRLDPFDGPVALLIDRLSASTSEMFAGGMQSAGRARLFGETSAGMALPAQMLELASGDFLMYAFADYRDGSGRRIEGDGVTPDVVVTPNLAALTRGTDAALARALDWIEHELSGAGARPGRPAPANPALPATPDSFQPIDSTRPTRPE